MVFTGNRLPPLSILRKCQPHWADGTRSVPATLEPVNGYVARRSLLHPIPQHVEADSGGVFAGVAAAFHRIVLLQGATQIELREDHALTVADTNALQLGRNAAEGGLRRLAGPARLGVATHDGREMAPPYLSVQIGSRGGMFSRGFWER